MSRISRTWSRLVHLYRTKGVAKYGSSEPVTELEHALQTYTEMKTRGGNECQCVSALFHDVGHLLKPIDPRHGIDDCHEKLGGRF